ncbi:DUF6090 family protein [Maribacter sp. R77961]|uniref:DUF6090 family protein n=1 Tax=Maribacter sp. R77961 TaxID=3093871 RepID=UPI0037C90C5B
MIKFFRRIRKSLLSENKFSKYLLYALGEIFLVMIGILLALQVNDWNEGRKGRILEQKILVQLKREYEANLAQLEEKIYMRNRAIEASHKLLSFVDNPEIFDEETFYTSWWHLAIDPTFDPIKNDIIGTDKLQLIQNEKLVSLLSNWSSEVYQVQEQEKQYQTFRNQFIVQLIIGSGTSRNLNNNIWKDGYSPVEALDKSSSLEFRINPSKRKIAFKKILADPEQESIPAMAISFHQNANIQSATLRNRIIEMLEIINSEIKND